MERKLEMQGIEKKQKQNYMLIEQQNVFLR